MAYSQAFSGDVENGMGRTFSGFRGFQGFQDGMGRALVGVQDFQSNAADRAREVMALTDKLQEENVQYVNAHRFFVSNFALALAVAAYTALFALPTYLPWADYQIFGQRLSTANFIEKNYTGPIPFCDSYMTRKWTNVAPAGEKPDLVKYDPDNASLPVWEETSPESVWCGVAPSMIRGYWGNAAQMIIFTVYLNTGNTVNLAWQGMIGTTLAIVNAWGIEMFYDKGDLASRQSCADLLLACEGKEDSEACVAYGDDVAESLQLCKDGGLDTVFHFHSTSSRTVGNVFEWFDAIGVIALFLFSGAAENTMKFGMSWHIYFMMNIMNPSKGPPSFYHESMIPHFEWDSEYMAVLLTSLFGVTIAIVATLVPKPLTNISKVKDDALAVTNAVNDILSDSVDYFCGSERSAKRFQIKEKIKALDGTVTTIEGNLAASWWETFDVGRFRDKRVLMQKFDHHATDVNDVMYTLKSTVLDETFDGRHQDFVAVVGEALINLKAETSTLLNKCLLSCEDGNLEEDEKEEMQEQIDVVEEKQRVLLAQLRALSSGVNRDLANEFIFTFSISYWSHKVSAFARSIIDLQANGGNMFKTCCAGMESGFKTTWNPRETCLDKEKAKFAFRNLVPITICFVIGYFGQPGSATAASIALFDPYNGTMASTLSLLISHFQGSAMQKNIQRLLGVVMGKALPIIVFTVMSLVSCENAFQPFLQFVTLMVFVFNFCYMYYTSAQFSTVGCLIAGFGTPMLMHSCAASVDWNFAAKYREIGQVTAAIMIQTLCDFLLSETAPRDMSVSLMRTMTEGLQDSLTGFFEHDLDAMKAGYKSASAALASAQAISGETDPKLSMVRGFNVPFKYDAYLLILDCYKSMLADMNMLIIVSMNPDPNARVRAEHDGCDSDLINYMSSSRNMEVCKDDLLSLVEAGFGATLAVLEHKTEEPVDDENVAELKLMKPTVPLAGFNELYNELGANIRPNMYGKDVSSDGVVRLAVALRCLRNLKKHMGDLSTTVLGSLLH
eukprot:TRINITY_DN388_c1_g1_i1.p1 TRINITY_DN388_c1_g1~~TRINITY_DN388_c1_g1_i1.p1  ORF type:complete len:1026 (+),score=254.70 TRINITY_DN388_c1_g1_i1:47-3079(+)